MRVPRQMRLVAVMGGIMALTASATGAVASTFDASVSPPRFEKRSRPGKIVRDIVRITNMGKTTGQYVVKTADWQLAENGRLTYQEGAPAQGSCRPWVRIERHRTRVPAGRTKSYRFEVHVPADAKPQECRFALLISADPQTLKPLSMGDISFPVVGRVAVIVYLAVGDAKPRLEFRRLAMREVRGDVIPVALIENLGNAHGRPFGSLTATDANGRRVQLVVEQAPILPGQKRVIELRPLGRVDAPAGDQPPKLRAPVQIRGRIEWDGGSVRLDQVVR
ncbi:MAG: hypothetical protein ACE5K1_05775 [Acidiferrobacterales bacterium]